MDDIWGSFIISGAIDQLREEIAYPRWRREADHKEWCKYVFFECDIELWIGKWWKICNTFNKWRKY